MLWTPTDNAKDLNKLKKSEPIVVDKIVIGIQSIQFGKAICILYSDGSIEFRDRLTMQETYNEPSLDRVMVLNQAGYTFADPAPCTELMLRPCLWWPANVIRQVCKWYCLPAIAPSFRFSTTARSSGLVFASQET